MANSLTTQAQKPAGIASYLGGEAVKKNIAGVIGQKNMTRFISSVVSVVQANPALGKCTNSSILTGALAGEASGLSLNPQLGQAHLVPYKNKKKVNNQWIEVDEAIFQIGWKGYLQLAIRSGQYKKIVVSEVKEGEVSSFNPITEELVFSPILDPALRESAPTIGYFAMFRLSNDFEKTLYWSMETMQAHAKRYSRGYRYDLDKGSKTSQWSTNFDAMAKKTMIRQLIGKWGIMSIEMQNAFVKDQGVIDEDGSVRYVDNPSSVPVEVQVQEEVEANANTEEFVETEVEPVKEEKPAPKAKSKKKQDPEPAAEVPVTFEEYPDEPDFSN